VSERECVCVCGCGCVFRCVSPKLNSEFCPRHKTTTTTTTYFAHLARNASPSRMFDLWQLCGGTHLGSAHPLGLLGELCTQAVLGLRRAQDVVVQLLVQVGGRLGACGRRTPQNDTLSLSTAAAPVALTTCCYSTSSSSLLLLVM